MDELEIVDARTMTGQGKLHIKGDIRNKLGWGIVDPLILMIDKENNRLIIQKAKS